MFFLLLVLSIFASTSSFFVLERSRRGPYTSLRFAGLYALLSHGLLIYIYNEAFSFFDAINSTTARLYWAIVALLNIGVFLWVYKQKNTRINLGKDLQEIAVLKNIDQSQKILFYVGLVLLVLPLLLLAVISPPNNLDSHNYHLSRIYYWLADQNVDHFPTMHVQQLYHNVFAEYIVMHCILLEGSDQLVGLVQFGAMAGSVVAISLLAKQFGLDYRGQLLTAFLLFSLPIGIFESTTTQNDYLACFFFISFVLFGYESVSRQSWMTVFFCLLSLVLGAFTKYTVLFFACPFALYFGLLYLSKYGLVFSAKVLLQTISLFAFVFTPFFSRNYALFGAVLSPRENTPLFTEKIPTDGFSVVYSVSNVLKNIGLHTSLPYNPYNRWVDNQMESLHRWLGISLYDQHISIDSFHSRFSMQEDMAPNTVHLLLVLISVVYLFLHRGNSKYKLVITMAFIGFVVFSTMLKFQFWSSRTHMPLFAISCLVIAFVFQQFSKKVNVLLPTILFVLSALLVYGNSSKMVIPLRYVSKKAFAHIPRDICPQNVEQDQLFDKLLIPYYDRQEQTGCYLVKKNFGYFERLAIFNQLDSIGYYTDDKSGGLLPLNRTKSYFANHTADYRSYAALLPHINQDIQNIGILFTNKVGFYHFWGALNNSVQKPCRMAYIRYAKEFRVLPNAQRQFCYNYILTDDMGLLHRVIPPQDIKAVFTTDKLTLVRLNRASCTTYLF